MKNVRSISLFAAFALAAITPSVHAQVVHRTFVVTGVNEGAKVGVDFWINSIDNTVAVDFDNTIAGINGVNGTVTGFGFNTPLFANFDVGDVNMTASWTQWNTGHNVTGSSRFSNTVGVKGDDFWNEHSPYSISPSGFSQDYGVSTNSSNGGNPISGIQFGEKATFHFTFSHDFTADQLVNFLDNDYDFTVRWQQVGNDRCREDSDKGGWDGFVPDESELPPTPEPSTYGLIGAASLLGLVARRCFKQSKKLAS